MKKDHCVKSVQTQGFFWSVFSRIRTEYGEIRSISPYSVRIRENRDQNKLRIWTHFKQPIFHRTNIGSSFLTGSYSSRDTARALIQIWGKRWSRLFFMRHRPIHFTSITSWMIKWNKLSFPSIGINKPPPIPVHNVS